MAKKPALVVAGAQSLLDLGASALPEAAAGRLRDWNPLAWPVSKDWLPVVQSFLSSQAGLQLGHFITDRLAGGAVIYPAHPLRALELTPMSEVRVVILGQDPYHGPDQAHGLAFSVREGQTPPPSLRNIFKEIDRSTDANRQPSLSSPGLSKPVVRSGSLEPWARQGVLLLNTCLTVEDGCPASHARKGWEALTDKLIQAIASAERPVVFMLWGAHAQAKRLLIRGSHLILEANHPSPLSANRPPQPFIGCGHFEAANAWLVRHGQQGIRWQ